MPSFCYFGCEKSVGHFGPWYTFLDMLTCVVLSCVVVYCHVLLWIIMYCNVLSCIVIYCHVVSCVIMNCHVTDMLTDMVTYRYHDNTVQ